jgi:outer membrane murein-binding lipoprotein Lpp
LSIPVDKVSSFTQAITSENGQLKADNTRLRSEAALAEAHASAVLTTNGVKPTPEPVVLPTAALPKSVQQGAKVMDDMQSKVKLLEGKLATEQMEVEAVKMADAQAKIKADSDAFDSKITGGGGEHTPPCD